MAQVRNCQQGIFLGIQFQSGNQSVRNDRIGNSHTVAAFQPASTGRGHFLILYLFGAVRFFTIIAALDTGSPFGAFGASREATLAMLTEPAIMLSLVAVVLPSQCSDLSQAFALPTVTGAHQADIAIWILAGTGLFLASLVELSRMPIDDPTTHLELTMVHEAMIIENSGKSCTG